MACGLYDHHFVFCLIMRYDGSSGRKMICWRWNFYVILSPHEGNLWPLESTHICSKAPHSASLYVSLCLTICQSLSLSHHWLDIYLMRNVFYLIMNVGIWQWTSVSDEACQDLMHIHIWWCTLVSHNQMMHVGIWWSTLISDNLRIYQDIAQEMRSEQNLRKIWAKTLRSWKFLNNGTISDDEEVAPDVPPWYLFLSKMLL